MSAKKVLPLICGLVFILSLSQAFAAEIKGLKSVWPDGSEVKWQEEDARGIKSRMNVNRVLCVDGLKVFQTMVFGTGNGSGAAVSNMQLYEEKNGDVVPVRCDIENDAK